MTQLASKKTISKLDILVINYSVLKALQLYKYQ